MAIAFCLIVGVVSLLTLGWLSVKIRDLNRSNGD